MDSLLTSTADSVVFIVHIMVAVVFAGHIRDWKLRSRGKQCPWCAETSKPAARLCHHCSYQFPGEGQ